MIGAILKDNTCTFKVWAPLKKSMALHIVHPQDRILEMQKDDEGYFSVVAENITAGYRYFFMPEKENDYPDIASNYQPEDVFGPSEVVDHNAYKWNDVEWKGIPFNQLILYELHVGAFTKERTFEAIIPRLKDIADCGINAIELMPVGQCPGRWNWGYDCVYPYAVQHSYGGPESLKKLVDACHQHGIAVFLDVIYNHVGAEGNFFAKYGPYFTDDYDTPWGDAINFDDKWSDGVRDYFINNTLFWFEHYHIDGLRLDAVHYIFDKGAVKVWDLLYDRVKLLEERLGRPLYTVAEGDYNVPRITQHPSVGGSGFTAQWLDDFHHICYIMLDENGKDRYADFYNIAQLAKAYKEGFVHSGEYVHFRKRKHGTSSAGVPGDQFVVFHQNHDQVGNRVKGDRIASLINFDLLKVAYAMLLLSPYVPLFFMGEEYGAETPFYFFADYHDEERRKSVNAGRQKEFEAFGWTDLPPEPCDENTINLCNLNWEERHEGKHKVLLEWNKQLIALRKTHATLQTFDKNNISVNIIANKAFSLHRKTGDDSTHLLALFNLTAEPIETSVAYFNKTWKNILDSTKKEWLQPDVQETKNAPDEITDKIILLPYSVSIYEAEKGLAENTENAEN